MTTARDEPHGLGDLIMETLAARYRLGEPSWPFKNEHRRAADKLAARGLITVRSDVMPHTFRAELTDAGRAMYIMQSYRVPRLPDQAGLVALLAKHKLEYGPQGMWWCACSARPHARYVDRMNWDTLGEAQQHQAAAILAGGQVLV